MKPWLSRTIRLALVGVGLLLAIPCAAAAIPPTMGYDGFLLDTGGKPLSSGQYDFIFSLYTEAAGGTPIWTETQPKVHVNNGAFHVVLGAGTPAMPLALPFDQQYYLGVTIGTNPEMTPRAALLTIPYSFSAKMAERVADSSVTTEKLVAGSVTDEKIKSVSWNKITGMNGDSGVPSQVWSLKGNSNSDPAFQFMGTTDNADLIFRTNNESRFNIHSGGTADFFSDFFANGSFTSRPTMSSGRFLFGDGSVGMERPAPSDNFRLFGPASGSFFIDGGNVGIGIGSPSSKLSISGGLAVGGTYAAIAAPSDGAIIQGPLGVGMSSPSGMLDVLGDAHVDGNLGVEDKATLGQGHVKGAMEINGQTHITDATASPDKTAGALVVAGGSGIGGNLNVGGMADVTGATTLENTLTVKGYTALLDSFSVAGKTTIKGDLVAAGPGNFGSLNVAGAASIVGRTTTGGITSNGTSTLNGFVSAQGLTNNGGSNLNGAVVINSNQDAAGDKLSPGAYPLRVQGSKQGMMITVTGASQADKSQNFVSFVDGTNTLRGSIEGQTLANLHDDAGYKTTLAFLSVGSGVAAANFIVAAAQQVASDLSTTTCIGFGVCETVPIPSLIVASIANLVVQGVQADLAITATASWKAQQDASVGVTYQSGSADYAEWLPKSDPAETMSPGDIVGVRGGFISKSTTGADQLMVISTKPIVLGNMPQPGMEASSEKVAFMGQIPVKVFGKVEPGDYIVAGGNNDGVGIAKHPMDLDPEDYPQIVGVAWSGSQVFAPGVVNVAVGINQNSVSRVVARQDQKLRAQAQEIEQLRGMIGRTQEALAKLVPGFKPEVGGQAASAAVVAPSPANSLPLAQPDFSNVAAQNAAPPAAAPSAGA
jgi:F0F1-type ATP synthase membrane subunit c/vacuolar-type H+-ATPase subunit K